MNTGVIASRYSKALLRYVDDTGAGEKVCSEAMALLAAFRDVSGLSVVIDDSNGVPLCRRKDLLATALGGVMSDELGRFVDLVSKNGRMEFLVLILRNFVDLYLRQQGVRRASLVTVSAPSEKLLSSLEGMIRKNTGCSRVDFETSVDPSLIGGFVLDIGDLRMDASIARQLEDIRRQLTDRNRRIV
ncbi:MAG: ATP synthase F1 subunit delta [Bacteroidales bacterium]|nr:ATP synthase F1 subunit delta [Bacteroidales bacterium]